MKIQFHNQFWYDPNIYRSRVFERYPSLFNDSRGCFIEVFKHDIGQIYTDHWYTDLSWIKQINRSISNPGVIRGMHAQSGKSCQGKMVQAVSGKIFDVITDARPNSDTFGVSDIFELDAKTQNQLWVPRGFLHGFIVPKNQLYSSVFEYFCDNEYNKASEICIAPLNIIKKILELKTEIDSSFNINIDNYELSEKDSLGLDYINWMDQIKYDYELTGKLWYV